MERGQEGKTSKKSARGGWLALGPSHPGAVGLWLQGPQRCAGLVVSGGNVSGGKEGNDTSLKSQSQKWQCHLQGELEPHRVLDQPRLNRKGHTRTCWWERAVATVRGGQLQGESVEATFGIPAAVGPFRGRKGPAKSGGTLLSPQKRRQHCACQGNVSFLITQRHVHLWTGKGSRGKMT